MKKLFGFLLTTSLLMSVPAIEACGCYNEDESPIIILNDIPEMNELIDPNYDKIPNVAQYRLGDWSEVVGRAINVTVAEAKAIADNDPSITYFFYIKGGRLVLENLTVEEPYARVFNHGDAVFFRGQPWWGSAEGLADGYIKTNCKLK